MERSQLLSSLFSSSLSCHQKCNIILTRKGSIFANSTKKHRKYFILKHCHRLPLQFHAVLLLFLFSFIIIPETTLAWKFRFNGRKNNNSKTEAKSSSSSSSSSTTPRLDSVDATVDKGTSEMNKSWFPWNLVSTTATAAAEAAVDKGGAMLDDNDPFSGLTGQTPFRRFVIPTVVLDTCKAGYDQFKDILFYKPPVGLAVMLVSSRLLWSGRIFRIYKATDNVEDELFLRPEKRIGRAWTLDKDDTLYSTYGGVERVRTRLCWVALSSVLDKLQQKRANDEPVNNAHMLLIATAADALQVSSRPTVSRMQYIHELISPITHLELAIGDKRKNINFAAGGGNQCELSDEQINEILAMSIMTAQIRITDALLRLCRDRILQTSYRLARTVEHWERRVKHSRTMRVMFQKLFRNTIEGDRMRLSLAHAAYNSEITRLGEITVLLMDRPSEIDDSIIIQALKNSEKRACPTGAYLHNVGSSPQTTQWSPVGKFMSKLNISEDSNIGRVILKCKLPVFSKYSIRWKAEGRGLISIRKFDDHDSFIDGPAAANSLLENNQGEAWMDEARQWTHNVRQKLFEVITEILKGSASSSLTTGCTEEGFAEIGQRWTSSQRSNASGGEDEWKSVVKYIDSTPSWRRIGEGQKIRIRDAFGLRSWFTRMDVFGIPSSLLLVYCATVAHERIFKPYWPKFRQQMIEWAKKGAEITQQRVIEPAKGIWEDLMNKSPGIMSALGLDVEETSLDHMLRDLNFGDGTPATRQEAIKKATEQYEKDVSSGLFTNLVRGRLVRLLLIQVQQLKVGLLSALDSIDVLVQGNRIYFKVLAAIPAVVIATYGTRYFLHGLYNIRARDLRPVTAVHGEMSHYLDKIENLVLLSDQNSNTEHEQSSSSTTKLSLLKPGRKSWSTQLKSSDLGEIILSMHRYLILLEFCNPPFPTTNCDQIHNSLLEFTSTDSTFKRLNTDRQLLWMKHVKQKHNDLTKFL